MKAILAKKVGMTHLFADDGSKEAITVLQAGPCTVTQLKTADTDGYNAVQIGYGEAKKQPKPQVGHLKAAKANSRHLAEYRFDIIDESAEQPHLSVGDTISADIFAVGDKVQVTAVSKGKGFAGTIKRHNFARGPKSHGSHNYRAPGSIGAGFPQHVFRGMRMAGRMGGDQVTTKNLKVMIIDTKNHLLAVRGAVPGHKKGLVMVKAIS